MTQADRRHDRLAVRLSLIISRLVAEIGRAHV